jgi:hypothetical protein
MDRGQQMLVTTHFELNSGLPWHQLTALFAMYNPSASGGSLEMPIVIGPRSIFPYGQYERTIMLPGHGHYSDFTIHPVYSNPTSFLPCTDHEKEIVLPQSSSSDLNITSTYMETLKVVCGIISNNMHVSETTALLVDLTAQKGKVQSILKSLFRQQQTSVTALREKLLHPAIQGRNKALVQSLLELGVDKDLPASTTPGRLEKITPLQCAVETGDEELVDLVLKWNPHVWSAQLDVSERHGNFHHIWSVQYSIVDHALELKYPQVLKRLLSYESQNMHLYPRTSLRTLRLAVLQDQLDLVRFLFETRPGLVYDAKQHPWELLEAAAFCEGCTMFDELLRLGLKPNVRGHWERGSVLVAAFAASNKDLINRLLLEETDYNAFGHGLGRWFIHYRLKPCQAELKLKAVFGWNALHMAVRTSDHKLVSLLLKNGADPNLSGGMFPLQIAAWKGDLEIVSLLLKNHASHSAGSKTCLDMFECCMVEHDYTVTLRPKTNWSPIQLAFERGHLDVIELLHSSGARVPPCDETVFSRTHNWDSVTIAHTWKLKSWRAVDYERVDWDPLTQALQKHDEHFVRRIISGGLISQRLVGSYLIHCIMRHGIKFTQELVPQSMLGYNGSIDPEVLNAAAYYGDEEFVVNSFSGLRVKIGHANLVQRYGTKALIMAVLGHHLSLVQSLLQLDINPYQTVDGSACIKFWRVDNFERYKGSHNAEIPPLSSAFEAGYMLAFHEVRLEAAQAKEPNLEITKLLLAWESLSSSSEQTRHRSRQLGAAYINAVSSGFTQLSNLISQTGLDIQNLNHILGPRDYQNHLDIGLQYAIGNEPSSPFEDAKRKVVLKFMFELGAGVNAPALHIPPLIDPWHTPLQSAAGQNNSKLIQTLLDRHADVNAQPAKRYGATALQFAAINGNLEIAQLLLAAGAEINAPRAPFEGRTAIEGAAEWGRLDMVAFLLSNGSDIRGKMNGNYRRAISRAWRNGHRVLAEMIQNWKNEQYGPEDCEKTETIVASITDHDLAFDARYVYEKHGPCGDELVAVEGFGISDSCEPSDESESADKHEHGREQAHNCQELDQDGRMHGSEGSSEAVELHRQSDQSCIEKHLGDDQGLFQEFIKDDLWS